MAKFRSRPSASSRGGHSRSSSEADEIYAILQAYAQDGEAAFNADTRLEDISLSLIDFLAAISEIEDRYTVTVPDAWLVSSTTLGDLRDRLADAQSRNA